jgi:hypothetical protein
VEHLVESLPILRELDGDKVMSRDFMESDEAEQCKMEKQHHRLERAHMAAEARGEQCVFCRHPGGNIFF